MPDISFPDVKLPDIKLPEGLRDMTREDIQKAVPEVRFPRFSMPRRSDVSKQLAKAGKEIEKAGKGIDVALPRRSAPSPVPFVLVGIVAGLVAGVLLATSSATGPRIGALADELRARIDRWRTGMGGSDDEFDSATASYPDALRSSIETDSFGTTMADESSALAVGPGDTTNGIGTPPEGVSSERF
jgi:hypothetical protein